MEIQNPLRRSPAANPPAMAKEAEQKMRSAEKATTGMKKRSVGYQLYRNRWLYLMLLLPIVYFAVFKFGPIYGLQIAFRNFRVRKGIWGSEWVGLKYFKQYLTDPSFWNLVKNTVLLGLGQIVFVFPCPIIFALLLNEIRSKGGQRLVQNISYLPHFISVVVVASMVTTFLAKDGIINKLVVMTGGRLHLYMQDPAWFRPIYWISGLWQELGWSAIIYFAALTNVDSQQYEAAVIDGANRWQQTIHVTLPAIKPTIAIMLIMAMGQMMNVLGQNAEISDRHHADHQHQHHGRGEGVAHLALQHEGLLVDVVHQHLGRGAGAAAGHDANRVEHAEGAGRRRDEQHEHLRRNHRQRDLEELLHAAGVVQIRFAPPVYTRR